MNTNSSGTSKRAVLLIAVFAWCVLAAQAGAGQGADPSGGSSRFTTLDGAKVHYVSQGVGREALVFVHGWTCNLNFWEPLTTEFRKRNRVVAIDLPGHGLSDKPKIEYTMDLFARAVDAVLRDAGVDRAVLVGHSMGVPVIRQFYRKHPTKTLALVLVDGSLLPFADAETMKQFMAPLRGPDYKKAAEGFIEGMLGPEVEPGLKAKIKSSMLATPQHVAVSAMDGMNDPAIWKTDKIDVPVLAIMAQSPFWRADTEQSFRNIAPKLEFQMWTGVSHFLMMEKPKEFNDAVAAFLIKNALLKK